MHVICTVVKGLNLYMFLSPSFFMFVQNVLGSDIPEDDKEKRRCGVRATSIKMLPSPDYMYDDHTCAGCEIGAEMEVMIYQGRVAYVYGSPGFPNI